MLSIHVLIILFALFIIVNIPKSLVLIKGKCGTSDKARSLLSTPLAISIYVIFVIIMILWAISIYYLTPNYISAISISIMIPMTINATIDTILAYNLQSKLYRGSVLLELVSQLSLISCYIVWLVK